MKTTAELILECQTRLDDKNDQIRQLNQDIRKIGEQKAELLKKRAHEVTAFSIGQRVTATLHTQRKPISAFVKGYDLLDSGAMRYFLESESGTKIPYDHVSDIMP